ncbi:ATP-dependent zinc metalloprotease YME1L [Hyalella azteca]|uniref:ATP-dependent zinc metalloprotease YME1L n=2 Tax=Hyalella azteca TaxID=294128 RepID=A0A8B7PJ68_HYAAZ|nr:ATP-dependent zinc metalloprotease YME1L [Hyalella azteca]
MMFGACSSAVHNQVLVPLSYLVSQASAGVFANTRSVLSNSSGHGRSSNGFKSKATTAEMLSAESASPTQLSKILSILRPAQNNPFSSEENLTLKTEQSKSFEALDVEDANDVVKHLIGNNREETIINLLGNHLQNPRISFKALQASLPSGPLSEAVQDTLHAIKPFRKKRKASHWAESYVSTESFLGNKHSSASSGGEIKPQSVSILLQRLGALNSSGQPLLAAAHRVQLESTRTFKTLRSTEQETFRHQSMRERLRGRPVSPVPPSPTDATASAAAAANSSRLKKAAQQQVKVAFAEGYLAADSSASGGKKEKSRAMRWLRNFQQMLAIVVLLAVLASVMSTMGGSLFRMNVTNGNEVLPEEITVTFDDVRGVEEAKQELEEIVEFLKSPEKFTSLGAELPKGVLLVGPPGTGKTLLARAVAGEAGVPFFHAAGPEFDEILVGQGARRVRDLFRAAKSRAPCVIFIDEIDSVGAKRTNSVLHPYANQTINQLLAEMDGFHKNEGVIVLGATNRRDDLDKALLRPGRFDVEVQVPIPDLAGRREIFQYYLGKVKIGGDVELEVLSRGTTGFTGADIKNVVNQAALRAAADMVEAVTMKHLEAARDKVLMGPEKKSRIPDEEVNLVTAYHEGGHTLVAHYTKHCHPLHKVTIIPRGPSLGHTAYIPAKEQYNVTRAQMLATLDSLMGGRAAEELIFGSEMITSGASSDLKQATSVATHMVKDLGMSDRVGLRTFEDNSGQLIGSGDSLSTSTKEAIDAEIKRLLQESYERARTILRTHAKEHKALAEALLKYETLDADDIKAILDGRSVSKDT